MTTEDIRAPAVVRGRLLTLVGVSLVTRFLNLSSTIHICLTSQGEAPSGRGCSCKTQAPSGIPIMISMSTCKTRQKLLAGRPWGKTGLNKMEPERPRAFHCYRTYFHEAEAMSSRSVCNETNEPPAPRGCFSSPGGAAVTFVQNGVWISLQLLVLLMGLTIKVTTLIVLFLTFFISNFYLTGSYLMIHTHLLTFLV